MKVMRSMTTESFAPCHKCINFRYLIQKCYYKRNIYKTEGETLGEDIISIYPIAVVGVVEAVAV